MAVINVAHGSTKKLRFKLHSFLGFLFTSLFIFAVYREEGEDSGNSNVNGSRSAVKDERINRKSFQRCDLFSGKWVFDNETLPLYKEQECPFMVDDYACQKFGREEFKYQQWRWQPHECDLPRFNPRVLLEKLRNKRLVFVGDSLNKNQWMSLVCMLHSSIPSSMKSATWNGSFVDFEAFEYNATVSFYWEPLLVESNCDDPLRDNHRIVDRIVRVGAIEKHAKHWTDADILIFDSFMWWLQPHITFLWGSFESPDDGIYKKVHGRLRSYEMAMRTWSQWLDFHLDRTKTKLFFMSLSPYHPLGKDWGSAAGKNCYGETEPISDKGYWGSSTDAGMMRVAEAAIDELRDKGLEIQYLNITQLSDYRKDAHPSIYKKLWRDPTEDELSDPKSYADCVHWCLPGVPDVWNQILYAYLIHHD